MSCGLYAVGRHSDRFPALPARKTSLSGPVCSTGSMDSDSRMGQGLGQNPENPKVIFPLKIACLRAGKEISARLRERAGPVKTRGTKRPARSQHHWPVCGFRRRSKETTPCPISGLPWPVFAERLERQKFPVQNQPNRTGSTIRSKVWISPGNRGQHRGAK